LREKTACSRQPPSLIGHALLLSSLVVAVYKCPHAMADSSRRFRPHSRVSRPPRLFPRCIVLIAPISAATTTATATITARFPRRQDPPLLRPAQDDMKNKHTTAPPRPLWERNQWSHLRVRWRRSWPPPAARNSCPVTSGAAVAAIAAAQRDQAAAANALSFSADTHAAAASPTRPPPALVGRPYGVRPRWLAGAGSGRGRDGGRACAMRARTRAHVRSTPATTTSPTPPRPFLPHSITAPLPRDAPTAGHVTPVGRPTALFGAAAA